MIQCEIIRPEVIKRVLRHHNLQAVSRDTGLHHNAVYQFVRGEVDSRMSTYIKLSDYVRENLKYATDTEL